MCRLTRAFAVCIHKLWVYRCRLRSELIWLAQLHKNEQYMDPRYLLICDKYQNLTCWSNIYMSALWITINEINNYFLSKGNTVKNKSDRRFQNLVYYVIHTCNINDNRVFKVTLLSISDLYGIRFNVKEI